MIIAGHRGSVLLDKITLHTFEAKPVNKPCLSPAEIGYEQRFDTCLYPEEARSPALLHLKAVRMNGSGGNLVAS